MKCITFESCDLEDGLIEGCSVECLELQNCRLDGFRFGDNHFSGTVLTPEECMKYLVNDHWKNKK